MVLRQILFEKLLNHYQNFLITKVRFSILADDENPFPLNHFYKKSSGITSFMPDWSVNILSSIDN